jgi:hypothetical protein
VRRINKAHPGDPVPGFGGSFLALAARMLAMDEKRYKAQQKMTKYHWLVAGLAVLGLLLGYGAVVAWLIGWIGRTAALSWFALSAGLGIPVQFADPAARLRQWGTVSLCALFVGMAVWSFFT